MKHAEFYVGLRFWTATGEWMVTDIGTRTVVAVRLESVVVTHELATNQETRRPVTFEEDPSWWNGPPYGVAEHVFDEYSIEGCHLTQPEA